MMNWMLGNLISLGASVFLAISCCARDHKRTYFFQAAESATLCVSSVFFAAWAGLSTQAVSVVRNALVMKGRFSTRWMMFFTVLVVVLGVAVNDRGMIGLLPVAATVQLTLCNHFCRTMPQIKGSFMVNAVLWVAYSLYIGDYVTGGTQVVMLCLTGVSIYRLARTARAERGVFSPLQG